MNISLIQFMKWSAPLVLAAAIAGSDGHAAPLGRTYAGAGDLGGVHRFDDHAGDCVTAAQQAAISRRVAANRARLGLPAPEGGIAGAQPPMLMPFYPMAGTLDADIYHLNFNDLNPASPAVLDFACTPFTYDGHNGIDTPLRSFAEQVIGVPIYSPLDGVVLDSHDGEPDMNTIPTGQVSNYIIIDHGYGYEGHYFHLKNGSVTVEPGDFVRAGEQIALTASSGNSTGPHLHFTVTNLFQSLEPFAGPCRTGASNWVNQQPGSTAPGLLDFGITNVNLTTVPGLPHPQPAHGQVALTDSVIYYWMIFTNIQPDTTWRFRFVRPNSTIAFDSGNASFGATETWRGGWLWFNWDVADMHTIPGLWHVDVFFNSTLLIHAPINVVATVDPNFNRPPAPISVAFESAPAQGAATFCKVIGSNLLDDVDYDVVRYQYVWRVNGGVVRDVTTAARSDALARDVAPPGSTVSCTVTPRDGLLNASPAVVSAVVSGPPAPCAGDTNNSGQVNVDDLLNVIVNWGDCP